MTTQLKIVSGINLQLPIIILEKLIISDMHHGISYIYINFQRNRVGRSVKSVHINIFAKNRKLHMQLPIVIFKESIIIIIIIKYQVYIALISNKCSEALNSATQNIIYKHSILMTSVITMKP